MSVFKRRRTDDQDLQVAASRVLARVQELARTDRTDRPFPLALQRAGEQPDGTIVRWEVEGVAFLQRRGREILACTPTTDTPIAPEEWVEVVLTPSEVASYFIASPDMQLACWQAMLMAQASREVTRSVVAQEELDEAVTDPRRQAILRSATNS